MLVNGQVIKSEELYERDPLTYYEAVYEILAVLLAGKKTAVVTFQSKPGTVGGTVFGLKLTTDPEAFSNYSF